MACVYSLFSLSSVNYSDVIWVNHDAQGRVMDLVTIVEPRYKGTKDALVQTANVRNANGVKQANAGNQSVAPWPNLTRLALWTDCDEMKRYLRM